MFSDLAAGSEHRRRRIQRLFAPRHIAFVGGRNVLTGIDLCRRSGYRGEVWLVNDRVAAIDGIPCVPGIEALPVAPDATFIGVAREATIDIVEALAKRDAGGAICFAAGYSEIGGDGPALQRRLIEAAGPLALQGPNCLGIVNRVIGATMWPYPAATARVERGPALVSQSGGLGLHIMMNGRSVDFAYVVSVGNQAVLGVEDYIDVLVDDPHVSAIGLYLEALRDVPAFHAAALRALERDVPIVVLKGGQSAVGAAMTMTHTSSLAGEPAQYRALFERLGVTSVDSPSELLETLKLFQAGQRPRGNRTVVFTCSGGSSSVAADISERVGLALPPLAAEQTERVRAFLPHFASVSNPLDYNTSLWGKEEELTAVFGAALDGAVDAGVLTIDFTPPEYGKCEHEFAVVRALLRAHRATGTPIFVTSMLSELLPLEARLFMRENGVAALQGVAEGLSAIAAAARFEAARSGPRPVPLARMAPLGALRLEDEVASKAMLAAHGVRIPMGLVVAPAAAAEAAERLGFPVAVKVVSDALAHKSDIGGVRLNLRSAAAVDLAVSDMVRDVAPILGAPPEQILVERMVEGAVAELIVGLVRDPLFGLVLALGTGGTMVEVVRDSALLLLPTDAEAIRRALAGLKVMRVLDGVRGAPPGDVQAIVDAVLALQRFALAQADRIAEIDVNPLMVLPVGQGAVAADAVVRLAAPA